MYKWGISTSDWHHGAKDANEMMTELYQENGFFDLLNMGCSEESFMGVVLAGDYFEKRLALNEQTSILAVNVFLEIYNLCKEHNKYFIVLRGTYSHDFSQLDSFLGLELQYDKFKLFNTVTEFEMDGHTCLAIPEEYMEDPKEFYRPFFSKKYDIIFGHGTINFAAHVHNSSERPMAKAPNFNENVFVKIAKLTLFGHVHQQVSYKTVHYNSSFSRLCFGEEDPKGFIVFHSTNKKMEIEHIENEYAPIYDTVFLSEINRNKNFLDDSIKMIQVIDKYYNKLVKEKTRYEGHRINLKVKIDKEYGITYYESMEIVKNHFLNKPCIVIEGGSLRLTSSDDHYNDEDNSEEDLDKTNDKYTFLLTEDSLVSKIKNFVIIKHGVIDASMTDDVILEALSKSERVD